MLTNGVSAIFHPNFPKLYPKFAKANSMLYFVLWGGAKGVALGFGLFCLAIFFILLIVVFCFGFHFFLSGYYERERETERENIELGEEEGV